MKNPSATPLKIGQASKILGVSIDTLRRWERSGKISSIRTPGGTRLYSLDQLKKLNPSASQDEILRTYNPNSLSAEELLKGTSNLEPHIIKHSFLSLPTLSLLTGVILTVVGGYFTLSNLFQNTKYQIPNTKSSVLAASQGPKSLKINTDTQINGSLFVRDSINNLTVEASPSANTFSLISGTTTLNVTNSTTLDQDVSTTSSPGFNTLNLSAKSNQIVLQSAGPTGTLTWTPTANRVITLPDATTTLTGTDTTQTLTNKTISGSSNTLSSIPNSALSNSKITISPGTNLSGGGDVNLGGSVTLALKDSITLAGTLGVSGVTTLSGATTLSSTLAVTGTSTFTGAVSASGNVTTQAALNASGNVGIGYTGTQPIFPDLGLAVAGNVGIGTTTPLAKLHVVGDAIITGGITVGSCTGCSAGGTISLDDGTASSPSLRFSNDLDTGLFRPGTNALGFATGGTSKLTITEAGNVGVGTTAPAFQLQTTGSVGVGGSVNLSGLSSGSGSAICINGSNNLVTCTVGSGGISGSGFAGAIPYFDTSSDITATPNLFWDNANTRLGIGTSNPDYNFRTQGTGFFSGFVGIGSSLNVAGNVGVGGSITGYGALNGLNVTGLSNLAGLNATDINSSTLTTSGNVSVGSSLTVSSGVNLSSSLNVSGNTQLNTLNTSGNIGIGGTATFNSLIQGLSGLTVSGSSSLQDIRVSTLTATGLSSLSTLKVSGASTLQSTVSLTGLSGGSGSALCLNSSNSVVTCTVGSGGISGSGFSGGVAFFDSGSDITASPNLYFNNSTGNLGIGTSNPDYTLKTQGTGFFSGFVGIGSSLNVSGNVGIGGSLNVTGLTTLNGGLALNLGGDATGDIFYRNSAGNISKLPIGSSGQVLGISFGIPNWTQTVSFTEAAGWVDAGAYIRLLTMGDNVGIGTTASQDPIGKLHLRGNDDINSLTFVTTNNSNSVFGLAILNNGNVGIGNTNPNYNFLDTGTAFFGGFVGIGSSANISGNVGIGSSLTVTSGTTLQSSLAVTGNTNLSTLNTSGNVGIGGTLTLTSAGVFNSGLTVSGFTSLADTRLTTLNASSITTTGNVGVGSSLTVTGLTTLNGGLALNLGSDATGDIFYRNSSGNISRLPIGISGQVLGISLGIPNWTITDSFTAAAGWVDAGAYIRLQTAGDNVGIGTTVGQDPIGKLHLRGNTDNTGLTLATTNNSNSLFGLAVLDNGNVGIGTTLPGSRLGVAGGVGIGVSFANSVIPSNGLAVQGNVGIGTTSVSANLIVAGNAGIGWTGVNAQMPSLGLSVFGNVGIGITTANSALTVNGGVSIGSSNITAPTNGLFVLGNVGIGFSSPDRSFQIANNISNVGIDMSSLLGANGSQFSITGSSLSNLLKKLVFGLDTTANYAFLQAGNIGIGNTNGLPLVLNPAGGNVGIGTTNPIAQFNVAGTIPIGAIGSVATGSGPTSVYVQGRYAYVANNGSNAFQIFDVSNPSTPVNVSSVAGSSGRSVFVQGTYAYMVDSTTFKIFDVSNPSSPVRLSSTSGLNTAQSVYVQGRYAYIADNGNGTFKIFDVSNPSSPVNVSSVSGVTNAYTVFVQGRYAYIVSTSNLLLIFDVSNPSSPSQVSSTATGSISPFDIFVQGRYAYVQSQTSFKIYDVSNPYSPSQSSATTINNTSDRHGIYIQGRYAYLVNNINNTVQIFDVSNPSSPASVGSFPTGSNPYSIFIQGRYAYIVNNTDSTLQVFDLGGGYIQQLETGGLETGGLQVRNNLTVNNDLDIKGGLNIGLGGLFSAGTVGIGVSTGVGVPALSVYQIGTNSSTRGPSAIFMGGNVGIGASLPNSTLSIQGTVGIGYTGANQLLSAGTVLGINGNIGIGTTTANSNLSVAGNEHIGALFQGIAAPANGLFVDGNVGIGATTSNNKLDVWGNARITGTLTLDQSLTTGGQTVNGNILPGLDDTYDLGSSSFRWRDLYLGPTSLNIVCTSGECGSARTWNIGVQESSGVAAAQGNLRIGLSNNRDFININPSGNVGIGTTNPSALLQVNGNVGIGWTATPSPAFPSLGLSVFGNVGIGTTTANSKLSIIGTTSDTTAQALTVNNSSNQNLLQIYNDGTTSIGRNNTTLSPGAYNLAVGIGATNPNNGNGYFVIESASSITDNAGLTNFYGYDNSLTVNGSGNSSSIYGEGIYPNYKGSGTLNAIYGIDSEPQISSGGNISTTGIWGIYLLPIVGTSSTSASALNMYGSYTQNDVEALGSVVNSYGSYIDTTSVSGTLTNNYGLYIANQAGKGNTLNFNLFSAGTGFNYLGGYVGIGTSANIIRNPLNVFGSVGIGNSGVGGFSNAVAPTNGLAVQGNVGIGTTSVSANLIIAGNAGIGWTGVNAQMPSLGLSVFGNVGIGTTSPAANLHVIGTAIITGSVTVGSCTGCAGGGTISLPDGTAAAPSLTFSNDSDTGLWRVGNNLTALTTNGSGALQSGTSINGLSIDPNGNVGIGTTSSGARLSVAGGVGIGVSFANSAIPSNGLAIQGNVGIGTTSPNNKLQVTNLINFDDANSNTFVGTSVGSANTTGAQDSAFGLNALQFNTTGFRNSAFGFDALNTNNTGAENSAFGANALLNNSTGSFNSAFGSSALVNHTTGSANSAFGYQALQTVGVGTSNAAFGYGAGNLLTGSANTLIGSLAGQSLTTGSGNIVLGYNADTLPAASSNQLNIGDLIFGTGLSSGATISAGNIGIGTTTPGTRLSVAGNVNIGWTGANAGALGSSLGLSVFGNVGIGTTSPKFQLQTTGNVGIGGSLTLTSAQYVSCAALQTNSSGNVSCGAADGVTSNVYTSNATWNAPANTKFAQVIVTASGGGGGGIDSLDTASEEDAGGGGAGGTTIEMLTSATLGGSQSVTVGSAGAAGSNTGGDGGAGNASNFGTTLLTANPGSGGLGAPNVGGIPCNATDARGGAVAGGAASSDGDVNLAGGGGSSGDCDTEFASGGTGGASYWGGGGEGGFVLNAGVDAGGVGAFGSGGGGAAGVDDTTGAQGGAGGSGVVAVFSYTGSGGDLAEWYETKAGVEPGDVVSVSRDFVEYESFALGLSKTSILEKASRGSGVIGVVSTMPFQVMGGDLLSASKAAKPIALAGRVPVKVSYENGKIMAGDLLTVSSVPGVAMRLTKAGVTIGRTVEDADCKVGEVCKVLVLVNTSYSNGALVKVALQEKGIDLDEIPPGVDIGRAILSEMIQSKKDIVDSSNISEIFTDRITAGMEIISPRVLADKIVANSLEPADKDLQVKLSAGGKFIIASGDEASSSGKPVVTFDSLGNTLFEGTITSAGGTDTAEDYQTADATIEAGDIVRISESADQSISKSDKPYQNNLIGIISTKPGVSLKSTDSSNSRPVSLNGRVPTKVSSENGLIEVGDYLTSSSTPGVAMKASRPGPTVGKALESYSDPDPTQVGKVLVFVNISYADPGNFFASLSIDSDGNLIIPKIRSGSIILDSSIASASSQLTVNSSQLSYNTDPNYTSPGPSAQSSSSNFYDLSGKIASLEDRISNLESKVAGEATSSATLTSSLSAELAEASPSSSIQPQDQSSSIQSPSSNLNLTPPDILLASGSATLNTSKAGFDSFDVSEATVSGMLTAYQAEIQDNFTVFGDTTLGNTLIAGNLSVNGTLSFDNGNEINAIGTLYLQKSPLAESLDILNGKITIDKDGNIKTQTVTADEFKVNEGKSAGVGKILAGQIEVKIENPLVEDNSIILITPHISLLQTLGVTERQTKTSTSNASFKVTLAHPETQDIDFDYLIIGVNKGPPQTASGP